ncbi:MAG TPA: class I SAM-dependent methyltransferase, partial [Solirubrobacteraceae bacterium]|nr:class I SAM-dependent methyltransferase [Solirubrobacteraceae bacterium]
MPGEDVVDTTTVQQSTLAHEHVHELWESGFRSPRNELFYELAFDKILEKVKPPPGSVFLEAGCGPGFHAMRLARRGYTVKAVDFSDAVLDVVRENVRAAGLEHLVDVEREDLVDLSYDDQSFDYALCWGVLMHVPKVERAIEELSRVIAPGGHLIVHEGNVHSPEAIAILAAKRMARRSGLRRTPAGVEHWKETPAGPLLTRRANIPWLITAFERQGLLLQSRLPTQVTELYVKPPWEWMKNGMYTLNDYWYRRVG